MSAIAERMMLRHFSEEEIILSGDEARIMLQFFFTSESIKRQLDDDESMKTVLREFAQALLVEAIDASYAMGFVEELFMSVATGFRGGAEKITKKFAKKALKHWFEHATLDDLWDEDLEIYETVRQRIEVNFVSVMRGLVNGAFSSY